jgi:hypothetical protein
MDNPNKLATVILLAVAAFLLGTLRPSQVTAANASLTGTRARPVLSLQHHGPTASGYPKHAPLVTGRKTWPKKAAKAVTQRKSTSPEGLPRALPYQSVGPGQQGMTYAWRVPAQASEATASCPPAGPGTGSGPASPIPIRPPIPPAPPVVGAAPPVPAPAQVKSASGWPRWLEAPYAIVSSLLSAPSR